MGGKALSRYKESTKGLPPGRKTIICVREGCELFTGKRLPIERAQRLAKEAYLMGYRSGVTDHATGAVVIKKTPAGYIIEEKDKDVPEDSATDRQPSD